MIKKYFLPVLAAVSVIIVSLTGCNDNTEASGQVETEVSKTIFDRVIMGTSTSDKTDLYLINDEIYDDKYTVRAVSPMGNDDLVVAYTSSESLVLKIYDIEDGNIITENELEIKTGNNISFIEKCEDSYVGINDEDNNKIYIFDENLKEIYCAVVEAKCTSLLVCPDYGRIFYTMENESDLYSYIPESEVSAVWFTPNETFDNFKIVDMASDNNTLIVSYAQNGHSLYSTISIEEQEFASLDVADCNIQVAGNDYLVYYPGEDPVVKIFNKAVPRVVTSFSLDSTEELNNIKAFDGPYLMTAVEEREGYTCRFYNIQEGILANSVILNNEINVDTDTDIFSDAQTAVLTVRNGEEKDFYLWDLSSNNNVLQDNVPEYYFGE